MSWYKKEKERLSNLNASPEVKKANDDWDIEVPDERGKRCPGCGETSSGGCYCPSCENPDGDGIQASEEKPVKSGRVIETERFVNAGRKWQKTKGMPHSKDEDLKAKIRKLMDAINPVTDKHYNRKEISDQLGISWQTVNRICGEVNKEREDEMSSMEKPVPYGSPWIKQPTAQSKKMVREAQIFAKDDPVSGPYGSLTMAERAKTKWEKEIKQASSSEDFIDIITSVREKVPYEDVPVTMRPKLEEVSKRLNVLKQQMLLKFQSDPAFYKRVKNGQADVMLDQLLQLSNDRRKLMEEIIASNGKHRAKKEAKSQREWLTGPQAKNIVGEEQFGIIRTGGTINVDKNGIEFDVGFVDGMGYYMQPSVK